ncbi:prolyl aminopeptidase [Pseudoroseomonas deserti]|uniref:Prolyl aminopeptidase n=1 Tax=Teichococcus deserti TaxID=1817963 RepID=A0A1V2H0S8_9PROT|nr:alpha/beta fold hydrolase [Pseudoroseomonas deserti]ONG52317.1 prolyl aminopeptidase [Pseudoroseomonas deserti]
MFASIRGTKIYFDIEGAGLVPDGPTMRQRPVAFILHGGPGGDHSGFKPSFSALAERMQLVYVDHRGQGRSQKGDPEGYTLDENVEDLEALRDYLGVEKFVSIGTSYGGMVSMAHAARYPASVSHLVAIVTAAHGGFQQAAQKIIAERGTPEQQRVCGMLWDGTLDTVEKLKHYYAVMGPLYSVKGQDPAAGADARARTLHEPAALNRAFRPDGFLRDYDIREELKNITAKTLVLAGRHDWICPPEFSEEIHRLIPGSDLRIFERSSHSIRADEPEALFDAIKGFLVY